MINGIMVVVRNDYDGIRYIRTDVSSLETANSLCSCGPGRHASCVMAFDGVMAGLRVVILWVVVGEGWLTLQMMTAPLSRPYARRPSLEQSMAVTG